LDQWCAGDLLTGFQQPKNDVAPTRDHPEDRWLLRVERAPSALALEPSAPSASPCLATAAGVPLCPATRSTSAHATSPLKVAVDCWATRPSRNWQVIGGPSDEWSSSAWALW
jgi:hypothetical protein